MMTTLVVVALDNLTLRQESDDPRMPDFLLISGGVMNSQMDRDRDEYQKVYDNLAIYGRATTEIGIGDDGLIQMRCVPASNSGDSNDAN